ncbi:MAG TPA: archaemetzincin [Candidatus Brocadiia bacterium]|nr:archaemetzincin [Candidatus Brocadiia bacterium]
MGKPAIAAILTGMFILCYAAQSQVQRPSPPAPGPERAFAFDPDLFTRIDLSANSGWLGRFPEKHVAFEDYMRSLPIRPTPGRNRILILPIGDFRDSDRYALDQTAQYAGLFFQLPVEIVVGTVMPDTEKRVRGDSGRSRTQYRTGPLIDFVEKRGLRRNAVCCIGLTMEDLYPSESWNFVFGEASLMKRIGVYSLNRLNPAEDGGARSDDADRLFRLRAFKLMTHETCHMFGLTHCIRYECVVNGSISLDESDADPPFLCPDCLRKLQWNIGFDVIERYRGLREFWKKNEFKREAEWMEKRLTRISLGE